MAVSLKDAQDVTGAIVEALRPLSVVVFGSVAARGEGEDLDLLIVSDENSAGDADENLLLHRSLKGFYGRFSIDPFVVRASRLEEHLKRGSPFLDVIAREGRVLYMKEAAREWLRQGREELETGRYLLGGDFFKGACFHAQQAVEKAIKAALFTKGWMLEKTHSVERLAAIAEQYGVSLQLEEEDVAFIDSIYRGRYPVEAGLLPFGEPSREEAQKAVAVAERMVDRAQKMIGPDKREA